MGYFGFEFWLDKMIEPMQRGKGKRENRATALVRSRLVFRELAAVLGMKLFALQLILYIH